MKKITEALKAEARKLLESNAVDLVIAYEQGSDLVHLTPLFATTPEKVDRISYNPFAVNNLGKYLLDYAPGEAKIGVVVKGCDSRALNRLIQDNCIPRERIVVIAVPCSGQLDPEKVLAKVDPRAELIEVIEQGDNYVLKTSAGDVTLNKKEFSREKCLTCETPVPVLSDITVGEVKGEGKANDYAAVKQLEALSPAEKNTFWEKYFSRCIRCNACRNVCSACNCRECVFDMMEPYWVSKKTSLSDNTVFHLTRAMHVAGRCVDCGECDRVCPMDIPLRKLNQKVLKDVKELFGSPTPGSSAEAEIALGRYNPDDPEEFM